MIPIYKPYMPDNLLPDIEKILYSGNLAYGKYGKLFEQALADYTGNLNILTVSSYNHAMQIVLSTLGLQEGDEIIASPVSCLASNQPFAVKNLKIVWADVNPETGSMCPEDVKKKITSKTKAIFHNHFCGYLGQIDEIRKIGIEHNLIVVDDCIEAFGSEFNGKKMGSNESDIAVFSFQTVRLPNTIDGAAISFKNQNLYEKAKMIRDYGIDRSKFRDVNGEISAECDIEVEGYGALMSEINSLIGIKQMNDIDDLLKKQRQNAIVWNERIAESKQIVPLNLNKETNPNFWVYGVLCEDKKLALEEFRKKGWYATGVHINNNIYSVFKNDEKLIGVSKFMNQFLALPCGWWVQ